MRLVLLPFLAFLFAGPAAAQWRLNEDLSHLSFGSIKKGDVGEVHHFTDLSGTVDENGTAKVEIDLGSLETWVDIRNERMGEFLFETAKYPAAVITTSLNAKALAGAAAGSVETVAAAASITLHGATQPLKLDLVVSRLSPNRVMVVPAELIMLDAKAFGLTAGIQKLAELADLPAISAAVPVTFHFVFERAAE